jgi:predicted nucleotide-binding protein
MIVDELKNFREKLTQYYVYRKKQIVSHEKLTKKEQEDLASIYYEFSIRAGKYAPLVKEYTGLESIHTSAGFQDVWNWAFSFETNTLVVSALDQCLQATSRTIGRLQDDIEKGIRDEQGKLIEKPQIASTEPPKAFIAHGGKSGVLDKLRDFIQALGLDPLVVELLPSKGMSVDDKVNKYIKDADCGIVLATKGGIVDTKGKKQKQHPRLNVIDEFERLRAVFPDKTILLLEKGVDLPSNIAGLTYEPFARQSMDRAFTAIARELTEMKILKALKPQE